MLAAVGHTIVVRDDRNVSRIQHRHQHDGALRMLPGDPLRGSAVAAKVPALTALQCRGIRRNRSHCRIGLSTTDGHGRTFLGSNPASTRSSTRHVAGSTHAIFERPGAVSAREVPRGQLEKCVGLLGFEQCSAAGTYKAAGWFSGDSSSGISPDAARSADGCGLCRFRLERRRWRAGALPRRAPRRLQAEEAFEPVDEAHFILCPVERLEDVEAVGDRGASATIPSCRALPGTLSSPPRHTRIARAGGVDRDVEAVLGPVVDEHIELQRGCDLAARPMNHEN